MKKTLSNYYLATAFIFIAVVTLIITAISHSTQYMVLNSSTQEIRENILQNYKDELKNRVEVVEQFIEQKNSLVREQLESDIKNRVYEAYDIAYNLHEKYKKTKSPQEIKAIIKESLRQIRFNEGRGYFFIDDTSGNCILYPIRPNLEGTSIINFQDVNQKYVIKELISTALSKNEGYTSYFTYKYKYKEDAKRYEKVTFVKLFEPYNWVIGTGEYLDDVKKDIQKEIAQIINTIRLYNNTGYINIYEIHDYNGGEEFATLIANPNNHSLIGKKISSNVVDTDGVKYRQIALDLLNKHGEGYVTYKYKKLGLNEESQKLAYIKKLKEWNWVLSTGVHLDKLDEIVEQNMDKLEKIQKHNRNMTWLFFLALFIILVFLSVFISRKISFEIGKIVRFFQRAVHKKEKMEIENFNIEDFKTLALYSNEMIETIHQEQDKLKKLNTSLEEGIKEKTHELETLNEYLKEKNRELRLNHYTDNLTKLSNRNKFTEDILAYDEVIVAIFDVDAFKNINDFYGTKTGDNLLVAIANTLNSLIQDRSAKAYRLSSDEFLLLFDYSDENRAIQKIKEILDQVLQESFYDENGKIKLNVSMTWAIAKGKKNILEKVDLALNYAKKNRLSYAIFDEQNPHMNTHKHNIYWRDKIQWAIENDLVEPYFQPIVNVQDEKDKKYEVLMRIVDGEEVISPYLFLEVAKETKQYSTLTRIMIKKSFEAFAQNEYDFSLNLSILDVQNEETINYLKEMIKKYHMKGRILLEIVESEEIINDDKFIPFVEEMRALGARFAIDDFGSGYSNFGFLLKMSPKYLKIDGALVKEITKSEKSLSIVKTIVSFVKQIDSIVIAEFVETQEIEEVLKSLGVSYMQGYHFSAPQNML